MLKKIGWPRNAYTVTDEHIEISIHRLKPVGCDIVVKAESSDTGALMTRVARLLSPGYRVFVKNDIENWLSRYERIGETFNGYTVFSTRS